MEPLYFYEVQDVLAQVLSYLPHNERNSLRLVNSTFYETWKFEPYLTIKFKKNRPNESEEVAIINYWFDRYIHDFENYWFAVEGLDNLDRLPVHFFEIIDRVVLIRGVNCEVISKFYWPNLIDLDFGENKIDKLPEPRKVPRQDSQLHKP